MLVIVVTLNWGCSRFLPLKSWGLFVTGNSFCTARIGCRCLVQMSHNGVPLMKLTTSPHPTMLIAALSSVSSASLTLSSSESSRVEGQWASVGVVLLQWRVASCETVKFSDDHEDVEVLEKREKRADLLRHFILWNSLGLQLWRTGQRGPFCFTRLDRTIKWHAFQY